ncbi:DUF3862 domain-containing protein [Eubacterium ventriosum]|mgnify:FL=1|jgi:hypothetical protein|uniref:DUF3862 domain-containing protein n=1 Tax=Eubacterium ventriosum TaxID=39496 RepID=A0A415L489_9FIRM|nr:DUF3862 domain-containing protein [Eubacterium ventriosum]RHL43267.1 DUF3862 domain-containing protein [Eubacterium ventriosum]
MSETKVCKFCQSEIPKKAKVCPNCKRTLKKGHGCLFSILVFIILICIGIAVALNTNDSIQKDISGVSDKSEYITMDEYNRIETGMSYDEVVDIIGSKGELSTKSESNGYTIEIYTWYGNGTAGSNANVTFENGKATAKAQVGLQ